MAKSFNPMRRLIDWTKRIVLEAAAYELASVASEGTGFAIEPLQLEHDPTVPVIEYEET
jgi:hypothetical protein